MFAGAEERLSLCRVKIEAMNTTTELSPALSIMRQVWENRGAESYIQLNQSLYSILKGVVECGIAFDDGDMGKIVNECRGQYWLGTSLNGHHFGEGIYAAACKRNQSAAKSYEASFQRTPFLLGSARVFEGFKFRFDGLYCHVTGWSEGNDVLHAVGYKNRNSEGVKKLYKFTRENWLKARKEMRAI